MPSKSMFLAFFCKQVERHYLRCSHVCWKCLNIAKMNASVPYCVPLFLKYHQCYRGFLLNSWCNFWFVTTLSLLGENTELPPFSTAGGDHSVLEDTVSPALSATVIIIVTIIMSGSAYLCFLKYICSGCCKATQVVPARTLDPSRSEEQV